LWIFLFTENLIEYYWSNCKRSSIRSFSTGIIVKGHGLQTHVLPHALLWGRHFLYNFPNRVIIHPPFRSQFLEGRDYTGLAHSTEVILFTCPHRGLCKLLSISSYSVFALKGTLHQTFLKRCGGTARIRPGGLGCGVAHLDVGGASSVGQFFRHW